jgi:hypothetical protein
MEIRIAVPRLPHGLAANIVGLLGLLGIALAVGGLAGSWWWSVLLGGVFAFGLALVAQLQAAAAAVQAPAAAAAQAPAESRPNLAAVAKTA